MDGEREERVETVIVGGGQAGLMVGHGLAERGLPFVILDASERVGDAWRNRWDSLRLFTPARVDGLPGMRFLAPPWSFPTKDEMADYLQAYAERFELPVRNGVSVDRLTREGGRYVLTSGTQRFVADNVVVATGAFRTPKVPPFAFELDPGIVQLHSGDYRRPEQLADGDVLVVGLGNSGAEIARDVASAHPVWLSGNAHGEVPFRHGSLASHLGFRIVRFLLHHVLSKRTPIGRKVGPKAAATGGPLIRVKTKDLEALGIRRVSRVVGVRDGLPLLDDDRTLDVPNVIWCTGFRHVFSWIDLPVFDGHGTPIHDRGVVSSEPGLYFMGLAFQFALSSEALPGMPRDAKHLVKRIAERARARSSSRGADRVAA